MASKVNTSSDNYHNAKGRVYSVFHQYGFIDVAIPSVNGRVYFNQRSFEDNRHTDLLASGLKAGDRVVLDFSQRPGTPLHHASRVCRPGYVPQRSAEQLPPRFDDEEGVICVLKDSHAFVRLPRFRGVTASFQKRDFETYAGRRVVSLCDVLEHGLKLRFDAERNPDERSKTKWLVERLRFVDGVPPAAETPAVRACSSEHNGEAAAAPKLIGQCGTVEKVSADHAVVRHHSGTAYLHASVVEECVGVEVEDVRKVLEEGSEVRFDADANGRQYGRGRWRIARVEILSWSSDTSQPEPLPVAAEQATARRLCTSGRVAGTAGDAELHELQLQPRLLVSGDKKDLGDDEEIEDDVMGTCVAQNVFDNERVQVPSLASHEEFPSLPSLTTKNEPSVSIYQNVSAVVASVTASSASCFVEQPDRSRTVKFSARCFYRNGVPVSGNLGRSLGGGDLVTLDFMVGTTSDGGEVVHCGLAWQGKKPRDAPRMSPEEMLARLGVGEAEDEDSTGPDDQFLHEVIDDDDLDELLGESPSAADPDEVDAAPTRRWRNRSDSQGSVLRTPEPPKNGARATAHEEALRYLLTNNDVPAFARMILQQLAASHLPNSRVRLRHASTQTEEL
ncbi:hypothetical protein V5799_003961 [Amblyomma americanum]|uniref:Uncharacterized protein n=1 Tax=Amblyomma americanum TaxID=6943 RepID=A0AAQ4D7H0_AMBAM